MKTDLFKPAQKGIKYWWIPLSIGVLAIILGCLSIIVPYNSLIFLTYIFMITFLVSGSFEVIFSIINRNLLWGWEWNMIAGIMEIILGAALLISPVDLIAALLLYFIGFWGVIKSISLFIKAFELRRYCILGWKPVLILSVIGILCSFSFLLIPILFKGVFTIGLIAASLLIYGISEIYRAHKMRITYRKVKRNTTVLHEQTKATETLPENGGHNKQSDKITLK